MKNGKRRWFMKVFVSFLETMLVICLVALPPCAARAGIFGEARSEAAPAATLGPYTMTPFPADPRPISWDVTSVDSPLGGSVDFDIPLMHLTSANFGGWSHGYAGDVYWTKLANSVELTLPAQTGAFYFYAQPKTGTGTKTIIASSSGIVVSQDVTSDGGAAYFGFYADGTDTVSTIIITSDIDFAVGEFGIAEALQIPDVIQAALDIDPDTLNLNSKGKWITCYIELPEDYDAEDIDISTIKLNDQVPAQSRPTGIGDCDNDGIAELMVKFERSAVQGILEVGNEVEITVSGELEDDTEFEGSDTIRVIDKGGKK
jgi:hypothetical protein